MNKNDILKTIPRMDVLLEDKRIAECGADVPHAKKRGIISAYLDEIRGEIIRGERETLPNADELVGNIVRRIDKGGLSSLRRVVNATGIVLHTNLGRAPLNGRLMDHMRDELSGYSSLEYDIENGCRGSRYSHIEEKIAGLTGAESCLVVNNNAAAVFLVLNTLARGKRVAISRGELVEIGGSFRVPDIMELSGAELVEVGTTNKTRVSDYEKVEDAQVFLKVHRSNFKLVGFNDSVSIPELVEAGRECECRVFFDLGAAFLTDEVIPERFKGRVKSATSYVREGADVICFSGDKLLGAAQSGIILGSAGDIELMKKNPFARMFRADKLTIGILEEALKLYSDGYAAKNGIPTLSMLNADENTLKEKAERLCDFLREIAKERGRCDLEFRLLPCTDEPGGGALPGEELIGYAVEIRSKSLSANSMEKHLRSADVPVVSRIVNDAVCISVRTLLDGDENYIKKALFSSDRGKA